MNTSTDWAALHAKSQAALVDFLRADLDLAFTMLATARLEAKYDPERLDECLARVRAARDGIRRFSGRVEEVAVREEIASRADDLEAALAQFEGSS
jgi:DNA repair ATPase RecN